MHGNRGTRGGGDAAEVAELSGKHDEMTRAGDEKQKHVTVDGEYETRMESQNTKGMKKEPGRTFSSGLGGKA